MTATLKHRLDKLVAGLGLDGGAILTCRMQPENWARIKLNKDVTVILFYPEKNDDERIEKLADIERLKKCVSNLGLVSLGDGYAVWEDGKCIKDGGLGHV